MKSGKFAEKSVKEANDEPRYVAWLLGHQAENDKFQNIMVYSERLELEKHRPKGMSSGSMPMTEEEKPKFSKRSFRGSESGPQPITL